MGRIYWEDVSIVGMLGRLCHNGWSDYRGIKKWRQFEMVQSGVNKESQAEKAEESIRANKSIIVEQ